MSKKIKQSSFIIFFVIIIVVALFYYLVYPAPRPEETRGTIIGAERAERYHDDTSVPMDIVDDEASQFFQSAVWQNISKDSELMEFIISNEFQEFAWSLVFNVEFFRIFILFRQEFSEKAHEEFNLDAYFGAFMEFRQNTSIDFSDTGENILNTIKNNPQLLERIILSTDTESVLQELVTLYSEDFSLYGWPVLANIHQTMGKFVESEQVLVESSDLIHSVEYFWSDEVFSRIVLSTEFSSFVHPSSDFMSKLDYLVLGNTEFIKLINENSFFEIVIPQSIFGRYF